MSIGTALLRVGFAMALVAMNGFFVVAEFALVSVRRSRIEELVAQGHSQARVVRRAIENPDRFIAATQLGITLASLGLGWIGEPAFADLIRPALSALPGPWDDVLIHSIAVGLAFALITFLHVVLGELAPKSVALQNPERASLLVARPIVWTENIFRPAIWLLNGAGNGLLRLFGLNRATGHQQVHSMEELKYLMRESQEGGVLEAGQEEMLQKVFQFGDRQVSEVMVPRNEVVGVEQDATIQDLLRLFSEASHARFPVYHEDLDEVVGIVQIKDVLLALAGDPARAAAPLGPLVRPALFVPETAPVADLLARMRATRNQMAIVLDEYGGTAGIVTMEELVEEIVGQMSDELVLAEASFVRLDERTVEIDAQLRVDEANDRLDLDLPQGEDYETVAGLVLYRLQHIPAQGEELRVGELALKVTEMRGNRIEKVQIRRSDQFPKPTAPLHPLR
jgi:CBS domain containing-hemolysin-like protein